jgi:transposase InsO family protein
MTQLYIVAACSKQGLHQFLSRQCLKEVDKAHVIGQAQAIRKRHPNMGCRTMFDLMQGVEIGRDRCERILLQNGFRLKVLKNPLKTTVSNPLLRYPDLIRGLTLNGINQVWQTDITYFLSGANVFYIIFIIDVYSRKIISWAANQHMRASANLSCLQDAIKSRKFSTDLIHHSDRGGQYGDKEYIRLLKDHKINISMCKEAWQNAYTERINGTIKNGYLYSWDVQTIEGLKGAVKKAVRAYNTEKPHRGLPSRMCPSDFEDYLIATERSKHPQLKIFDYEKK